jgi:hypothetical protein
MTPKKGRSIEIAIQHLESGIEATQTRVEQLDNNTYTAIQELQTASQEIDKRHNELQRIHDKICQEQLTKENNADRAGRRAQHQTRLDEVESIVLSASMPNATPKRIPMFAGYDSQDPKCILSDLKRTLERNG